MEIERLFKINFCLQVYQETEQIYYESIIKGLEEPHSIIISQPVSPKGKLEMPAGSVWNFFLSGQDALYQFSSRVLGEEGKNELYYRIERPQQIKRQQRREYYRLLCSLELEYWAAGSGSGGLLPPVEKLVPDTFTDLSLPVQQGVLRKGERAFSLNLSGGGLQMITREPLSPHTELILKLHLTEKREGLVLKGKTLRVSPVPVEGQERFRVVVLFVELPEKVRERIINFIFEQSTRNRS